MARDHHLQEIEDRAARDGVNTFKAQLEIVILSLLSKTRSVAAGQVEEARTASLEISGNFGSLRLPPRERIKSSRVAQAMLAHTFARLNTVITAPSGSDGRAVDGNGGGEGHPGGDGNGGDGSGHDGGDHGHDGGGHDDDGHDGGGDGHDGGGDSGQH